MPKSAYQECIEFIEARKPKLAQGRLHAQDSQDRQSSLETQGVARVRIGDQRSNEVVTLREVKESPHMPGIFYGRDERGRTITFHYSQFLP